MSKSPNLVGLRVTMMAADHPYADQEGIVIAQERCGLRRTNVHSELCDCGYDDLIVKLDSGELTRVYEPEADTVPSQYGEPHFHTE